MPGDNVIDFYCEHALATSVPEDQGTAIAREACAMLFREAGSVATVALIDTEEVTTVLQMFVRLDVLPEDDQIIGPMADAVRDDLFRRTGLDFSVSASYGLYADFLSPSIAFITPDTGGVAGGTSVSIQGARLDTVTSVKFGLTSATFSVVDSTELTATTPAHLAGAVDLTLVGPAGTTVLAGAYTYA